MSKMFLVLRVYSQAGAYFVTICTQNWECLFGDVVDGEMKLNDPGRMVQTVWNEIPVYYSGIDIDACQIIPNHLHGIIVIVRADPRVCPEIGLNRIRKYIINNPLEWESQQGGFIEE